MAVYVQPNFNVLCNVWRNGTSVSSAPDLTPFGNLSPGRLVGVDVSADFSDQTTQGVMWLRLPANTDIRDNKAISGADTVECPAASGKFYAVVWVDDIGTGFSNQHRFAALAAKAPWGVPFGSGNAAVGNIGTITNTQAFNAITPAPGLVTMRVNLGVSWTGNVIIGVVVINDATVPTVNGFNVQTTQMQTVTEAGQVARLYVGGVFLPVPSSFITVGFLSGGVRLFAVMGYLPGTKLKGALSVNGNSGNFAPPNVAGSANPFLFPALSNDIFMVAGNGPGSPTVALPYLNLVYLAWGAAGITWTLMLPQLLAPLSPPTTVNFGPMGGWNHWGVIEHMTC